MISNQSLSCSKGASLTFEIDMEAGTDLTGATAQWAIAESWFDNAKVYLIKTGVDNGLFINQEEGVWKIIVNLVPSDTLDIPSGLLYHDCKVLLQNGDVGDVANGPFYLDPSVNVLETNAPSTRNLRGIQTVGQLGQIASVMHAGLADWFVDSVAGSDGNAGTLAAPFATLAKIGTSITANPAKTSVALKRGSAFRESLPTTVTSCIDYGSSGSPPIIDGSNIITGWTVNGTQSAVWEKTLTIDTGGRPRIFENGILMPWVADLATCASTAGSRVLVNDGGTITLQMHPIGGDNPNTNGKTYEATVRSIVVAMGDNCTLKGIHTRRAISNNGSIQIGSNAVIERCLAVDGSKHSVLLCGGSIVDTIALRADAPTPSEPSNVFFVGFDARGLGTQSVTLTRVGCSPDGTSGSVALISHDLAGGSYSSVTAEQVWISGSGSFGPTTNVLSVQGYYAEQCTTPIGGGYTSQMTFDCFQINNTGLGSDTGIGGLTEIPNISPQTIIFKDGALYCEGSSNAWFRLQSVMNGYIVTLQNTAWATSLGVSRGIMSDEGWSSGSMSATGNIFHTSPYGTSINVPTGVSYTGNDNVFAKQDGAGSSPGNEWLIYHGTTYHGLGEWQAGIGQDANSFEFEGQNVAQLFSGTYSAGDYRLAGTGIGAAAAAINAGPLNHWDWNAKAKVSGPPTAWPTVPKTLANAITYVSNPTAWGW